MPSISRVRRAGRCDCSTRRMISSFSEPGSLMPRLPHPRSCFFEQPQFERLLSNDLFQLLGLTFEILDLVAGRRTRGIAGEPPLAGLQELFRPAVVEPLGNA